MGKNDIHMKKWLSDKRRFASLVNGALFGHNPVFSAESLQREEKEEAIVLKKADGTDVAADKYRDVSMRSAEGTRIVVLACENQEEVHYAMVIRNMLYDALNYTEQVQQIRKKRKRNRVKGDSGEFLSGIGKKDLLYPVLTVIFYYGDNEEG